jgi:hypothetical protein
MKNLHTRLLLIAFALAMTLITASAADFNKDGHPDILLYNETTRQLAIWYLNGSGGVTGGHYVSPAVPAGWNVVDTGDLNGDGYPDVLLWSPATRKMAVWYLHDNVIVAGAYSSIVLPAGWIPKALADNVNLITFEPATGKTRSNTLGSINSIIYSQPLPTIPPGWALRKVLDRNFGGMTWFVLQNMSTGQVVIWYMSPDGVFKGAFPWPTVPHGWVIADVFDVNGDDGNKWPDLILFNPTTHQTAIWLLDADGHIIKASYGPTLPAAWKPFLDSTAHLCAFTLTPASKTALQGGGFGTFVIGCDNECQSVARADVPWLKILDSPPYFKGSDTATYSVEKTTVTRKGTITVYDKFNPANFAVFTVTQNVITPGLFGTWTGNGTFTTFCGGNGATVTITMTFTPVSGRPLEFGGTFLETNFPCANGYCAVTGYGYERASFNTSGGGIDYFNHNLISAYIVQTYRSCDGVTYGTVSDFHGTISGSTMTGTYNDEVGNGIVKFTLHKTN